MYIFIYCKISCTICANCLKCDYYLLCMYIKIKILINTKLKLKYSYFICVCFILNKLNFQKD